MEALDIVKNETTSDHEEVKLAIVTDLSYLASQIGKEKETELIYDNAAQVIKEFSDSKIKLELTKRLESNNSKLSVRGNIKNYSTKNWPLYMDNIPSKKLRNALNACNRKISEDDVIALLDNTLFGSAKLCVIFTNEGVHYREDWGTRDVGGRGPHFKLYSEMDLEFEIGTFSVAFVKLGGGSVITPIGTLSTELLFELLQSICSNLQN